MQYFFRENHRICMPWLNCFYVASKKNRCVHTNAYTRCGGARIWILGWALRVHFCCYMLSVKYKECYVYIDIIKIDFVLGYVFLLKGIKVWSDSFLVFKFLTIEILLS